MSIDAEPMRESTVLLSKIEGNTNLIADFRKAMREPQFKLFEKYHPPPQKIKEDRVKNWLIENWGCESNPSMVKMEWEGYEYIKFSFESLGAPPIPFFLSFALHHKSSTGLVETNAYARNMYGYFFWEDGAYLFNDGSIDMGKLLTTASIPIKKGQKKP